MVIFCSSTRVFYREILFLSCFFFQGYFHFWAYWGPFSFLFFISWVFLLYIRHFNLISSRVVSSPRMAKSCPLEISAAFSTRKSISSARVNSFLRTVTAPVIYLFIQKIIFEFLLPSPFCHEDISS